MPAVADLIASSKQASASCMGATSRGAHQGYCKQNRSNETTANDPRQTLKFGQIFAVFKALWFNIQIIFAGWLPFVCRERHYPRLIPSRERRRALDQPLASISRMNMSTTAINCSQLYSSQLYTCRNGLSTKVTVFSPGWTCRLQSLTEGPGTSDSSHLRSWPEL